MKYKILNFLFGWDYIQWQNSADTGVARVFRSKCGQTVYWRYYKTKVLDKIKRKEDVVWLTCKPSKYLVD